MLEKLEKKPISKLGLGHKTTLSHQLYTSLFLKLDWKLKPGWQIPLVFFWIITYFYYTLGNGVSSWLVTHFKFWPHTNLFYKSSHQNRGGSDITKVRLWLVTRTEYNLHGATDLLWLHRLPQNFDLMMPACRSTAAQLTWRNSLP